VFDQYQAQDFQQAPPTMDFEQAHTFQAEQQQNFYPQNDGPAPATDFGTGW
jgi:hypothetical protein